MLSFQIHVDETSSHAAVSIYGVSKQRTIAIAAVAIYAAALIAPGYQLTEGGKILHPRVEVIWGWRLAAFGWLGPLELSFAWFANIPLAICVIKIFRGKAPGHAIVAMAVCLGLSALLPLRVFDPIYGWSMGFVRGPTIWLWLVSIAMTVVAAIAARPKT